MTPKNKKKETETAQATPVADVSGIVPVPAEESSAVAGKEKKKSAEKSATSVLENVGKSAIARHGFAEVFVTSDGMAFRLRSDAQHHAADLANRNIIKVTGK